MSRFDEQILNIRKTILSTIGAEIKNTRDRLAFFPRDIYLPAKLEYLESMQRSWGDREGTEVIHLEELREYKYLKDKGQLK